MSSSEQLVLPLERHHNHYLFSDYYLNTLLPQQPSWREADAEAAQALDALRQLHAEKSALLRPALSEAALEEEWVRPILDILGHAYHVGASLPSPEGTRTPDYALFPDEETRRAALPHLGTAEFFKTALAVADAKRWDRSLDRRLTDGAGDAFSNANPSYQIDYYLRITGCDWGLLTNGRLWRLYHRESSFRLDVYYEVDLINLLQQGQVEHFKYFYLFFRRAALPEFLNRVLRESREYAQGVSEDLKERVYEALHLLAEGFLKYPGTSLTPADLKAIHDNALILLYRLLFIFYAESRRLLPLENRSYAELYSLKAIKEEIADRLDRGITYLPRRATIWDNLKALFHIINEGSDELGVPAYNGRLFDPAKYPFLEEHSIGDAYLVRALDLLARTEGAQGLDFVDYRDLEIRHLGSIYEGLLEYQLRYADRDMTMVKDRKGERVVPAEEGQKVVFPAGSVYLVTDRGERKATGSYYTPDYIVKYIVKNTLGPLVDEKERAVRERLTDLEARLRTARGEERELLERELARVREGFGEAVLELKVLDPAMGSGHFLVEATDYLAQRIVDMGITIPVGADGSVRPGPTQRSAPTEMAAGDETEISYWRRRVVESCIYGVDVNPLAVELAKLSLWLATAAKGKPLSFLDHHLRCGNSLIGARLEDLGSLPVKKGRGKPVPEEQMALFDEAAFTRDVGLAVGGLATIQGLASDSVEDIHQKERILQELLEVHLKRWRQIADLWVSAYFGNEMTPEVYADLVRRLQTGQGMLPDDQARPYLERAGALSREKRFFHWELEFPEVFFDRYGRRKENPGFDAVVGNPPWGGKIQPAESSYYRYIYRATTQQSIDTYKLFTECALKLWNKQAYFGFIMPNTFLTQVTYLDLRLFLMKQGYLYRLVNLGDGVFEGVTAPSCILCLSSVRQAQFRYLSLKQFDGKGKREHIHDTHAVALPEIYREVPDYSFIVEDKASTELLIRLLSSFPGLGELKDYQIRDVGINYNRRSVSKKVFYVGPCQDPRDFPRIKGGDFNRYSDVSQTGWLRHNYNSLLDEGESINVCQHIYELPEKLIFRQTSDTLIATIDTSRKYLGRSVIAITREGRLSLGYLLTLFNSKLLAWIYNLLAQEEARILAQVKVNKVEKLPIRRISFTMPREKRERLVEEGIAEATEWIEKVEEAASASFSAFSASMFGRWLDARLTAEPEQSDVVHDLLAHLAERMIEMNKEKQAEVRGFLTWLEREVGASIDDLTGKTKLRRYLGDYQKGESHLTLEEFLAILRKNRRKLRVDVSARAFQERLAQEYQASLDKLLPLKARLAATDRLIDLIVYRLYGLTEEEVAVVEG